ncbi:MAG: hypothetical protein IT472_00040 [Thermomonas sp.]|nr:hypothetical protein [Thermomonas sp.]
MTRELKMQSQTPNNVKGSGIGFLGAGAAFLAIGISGQVAFIGVGAAFLGLGIAFLVKARRDDAK